MKNFFLINIFLLSLELCNAQTKQDSTSRAIADAVLANLDAVKSKVLLYSISDRYFYLIYEDSSQYKTCFVVADSSGKIEAREFVKASDHGDTLLLRGFDLTRYKQMYITDIDSPTLYQGVQSYFVIKDREGRRYGEYRLPVLVAPVPIDRDLYNYLLLEAANHASSFGLRQVKRKKKFRHRAKND